MFEVRNEQEEAEVVLYDLIGKHTDWWTGESCGVSAQEFKDALESVSPKPVVLRIDSSGGDVFDAFAMCSAIQRYPGRVKACVDGLAASAASYIAVVCDEVEMADYAYLMIHCASSQVRGNARDLEDVAARLRNIDANLAAIYEKRSNLTVEQVLDYMADETWFTASEALEHGLCTGIAETEQRIAACIDPAMARDFRHVPEGVSVRAEKREQPEEQAPRTVGVEEVEAASLTILDGRIYGRKEVQDEQQATME